MNAPEVSKPAHIVYIGLGSNIDPEQNMHRALVALRERTTILCESSVWRSPALGTQGPDFHNAIVKITTALPATDLKSSVLAEIEHELGRKRGSDKFAPRTIDLDILIYDDTYYDENLFEHAHLAVPLAECSPTFTKPGTGLALQAIAKELLATSEIRRVALK